MAMIGALKACTPQPVKSAIRAATRWLPHRPRPAILMYHRIASASFDPWGLAVEEQNLAAQLEWLAANRSVMPLREFARLHREGQLPPDAIAITFDDGYESAVRAALPLLERAGLHATIFLPIDQVERASEFWWDELARILLAFEGTTIRLAGKEMRVPAADPRDRSWCPDSPPDTPRQVLFYSLWSRLRERAPEEIEQAMREVRDQAAGSDERKDGPCSVDRLRSLNSVFVDVGSHALTHPSLPTLTPEHQAREIDESRERCAQLTGKTPATFAYPYGDFDERTRSLVEDAGFDCACTTEHACVSPGQDVFALPRLRVGNWGANRLRDMLRYA